jgi:hypothetical protein
MKTKERETGIEPATSSLGSWHSTAELLPLNQAFTVVMPENYILPLSVSRSTDRNFDPIVYAHQMEVSIGQWVTDLELIAKASDSDEWINRI